MEESIYSSNHEKSLDNDDISNDIIQDLVTNIMQFKLKSQELTIEECILKLNHIHDLSHAIAKDLLLGDHETIEDTKDLDLFANCNLSPPKMYLSFKNTGQMHLPVIDWSNFKGYTFAVWLRWDYTKLKTSNQFQLYHFSNSERTFGVEANLRRNSTGTSVILQLRSGSLLSIPERDEVNYHELINISSFETTDEASGLRSLLRPRSAKSQNTYVNNNWQQIEREIELQPLKWQLLVITHTQHYVKKSDASCYVNSKLQWQEEFFYPSILTQASHCTIGNPVSVSEENTVETLHFDIANILMFREELSLDLIHVLYLYGPSSTVFNRGSSYMARGVCESTIEGFNEETIHSSLLLPTCSTESTVSLAKTSVLFNFSLMYQSQPNVLTDDLIVEWLPEGSLRRQGKWLAMKDINRTSGGEVQQRTARLDKNQILKIVEKNLLKRSWSQSIGVQAVPILLHYIFEGCRGISDSETLESTTLFTKVEAILISFLWILKGLLLNQPSNQQQFLKVFGFHLLQYAVTDLHNNVHWSPNSIYVWVQLVMSFRNLSTVVDPAIDRNHPTLPVIWDTNPVLASALRVMLLDTNVWQRLSFKHQCLYFHQLYRITCDEPKAMNDLHAISMILKVFRTNSLDLSKQGDEQNAPLDFEEDDLQYKWRKQSIHTLMEILEICISSQSVYVHVFTNEEVKQTTNPSITGSNTKGSQSSQVSSNISSISLVSSIYSDPATVGGVFSLNLEHIEWSDQEYTQSESKENFGTHESDKVVSTKGLEAIHVRLELVRNVRRIVRFLITSFIDLEQGKSDERIKEESCIAILTLLHRLARTYLDFRFACLASNLVDALLYLLTSDKATSALQLAILPLLLYFIDWLESVEGRTLWCGLDDHLRFLWTDNENFSLGFLELMMELYFDPIWVNGFSLSILMNDITVTSSTLSDSVLFPMSAATQSMVVNSTSKLIDPAKGKIPDTITSPRMQLAGQQLETGMDSITLSARTRWYERAKSLGSQGNRLGLSWEKRLSIVHLLALQTLQKNALVTSNNQQLDLEESTTSIISTVTLPRCLPFLPVLLQYTSAQFCEQALMDVNVRLKTDESIRLTLLQMKNQCEWAFPLVQLAFICTLPQHKASTSQDLVVDSLVSLICTSITQEQGASWINLVLRSLLTDEIKDKFHDFDPFRFLTKVMALVLQRMTRSQTILTKVLGQNLSVALAFTQEHLLPKPQCSDYSTLQLTLCQRILELSRRLVASTHPQHRVGLKAILDIFLQHIGSLPDQTLVEEITSVLVDLLRQEMGMIGILRIYEPSVFSVRDVFIHTLVALRQALTLRQHELTANKFPESELDVKFSVLYMLILKIASSGIFTEELKAGGTSVQQLSVCTEQDAVLIVLNVLAEELNIREAQEIEEQHHYIPKFPLGNTLKELCTLDTNQIRQRKDSQTSVSSTQDAKQLLCAAMEVEQTRMLQNLASVRTRERQRMKLERDEMEKTRLEWTKRLWAEVNAVFESQQSHKISLNSLNGDRQKEYSLSIVETPLPSRMHLLRASECKQAESKTPKSKLDNATNIQFGRKFVLEEVGRVVAEQGGKEITDITKIAVVENMVFSGEIDENEPNENKVETSNYEPSAAIVSHSAEMTFRSLAESDRKFERIFHPSEGLGITTFPLRVVPCRRVLPQGNVPGKLFLCATHLVFEPDLLSKSYVHSLEDAPSHLFRCWRWKYRHIIAVYMRCYRLRDSAMELFMRNGRAHFIDFTPSSPGSVKEGSPIRLQRNEFVRHLYSLLPRGIPKERPQSLHEGYRSISSQLLAAQKSWCKREMSNFDYIMTLNTLAGRSFNDLTQYPIFPWILKNYKSEHIDLRDPANFRDLSKPIGALNQERLEEFWERYHSFEDPVIPKFLYGSHYSTCAGVVCYYLLRMQPFTDLHRKMQGGEFDLADRLFNSISDTWDMCNSHMSEVKELTPEFFAGDGTFLTNSSNFDLGKKASDGVQANDVLLPPWACNSPQRFIQLHRDALESSYVSAHLHEWIDLIFGFKQRGKAALEAANVFYYLTYYGVVDLEQIEDPHLKESMELQIAHFGQCPIQLFSSPHPAQIPPQTEIHSNNGTYTSSNSMFAIPSLSRPLVLNFLDYSPDAIANRKRQTFGILVPPLFSSSGAIVAMHLLVDRCITINEIGVIDLFFWRLTPNQSPREIDQNIDSGSKSPAEFSEMTTWQIDVLRDSSPFEFVPRVPIFETKNVKSCTPPVIFSRNGRLVISTGGSIGALFIRLLDLDTGHVIAKASFVAHSAAVSCLFLDRLTYRGSQSQQERGELLLTGAVDGTLSLWKLSRVNQDLLALDRMPQISAQPIAILRGHAFETLNSCCVSSYLQIAASCTNSMLLVHALQSDNPHVVFTLPCHTSHVYTYVCISIQGFVITVCHSLDGLSSSVHVYNLAGIVIAMISYPMETIRSAQVPREGDVVILTLGRDIIRICRIPDLQIIQEYESKTNSDTSITVTTIGPTEAMVLLATGHKNGAFELHLLPNVESHISYLTNVQRLISVQTKLKQVKGKVQTAQNLAISTYGNAKAATSTARDIAGEAIGEAKSIVRHLWSSLQNSTTN